MDELFRLCRELNDVDDDDDYDGDGRIVERRKFVPWLDCARSYGLSEEFVGDYLRLNRIMPEDVYVSSKWGYTYVADWRVELGDGEPHEIKDHSLEVRDPRVIGERTSDRNDLFSTVYEWGGIDGLHFFRVVKKPLTRNIDVHSPPLQYIAELFETGGGNECERRPLS